MTRSKTITITADEALAAIDAACGVSERVIDAPPAGYVCANDMMARDRWNCSFGHASRRLQSAHAAGKLLRVFVPTPTGGRRAYYGVKREEKQ